MSNKGRPTKYDPKYCEMVIEHMTKGYSARSFAAIIDVNFDTIYEWQKANEDFSDAVKIGTAKMNLFYEEMGHRAMLGKIKGFSAAAYIFTMKNKIGWVDRAEVETNASININIDKQDIEL